MHIGLEGRDASAHVQLLSEEDVRQRVNVATNTNLKSGGGNIATTEQKAATASQHTLSDVLVVELWISSLVLPSIEEKQRVAETR